MNIISLLLIDVESSVDCIIVDGVFQLRLKSVGMCQQYSEVSHNFYFYVRMPDLKLLSSALNRLWINVNSTVAPSKTLSLQQLSITANVIFQSPTSTKMCSFVKTHQML